MSEAVEAKKHEEFNRVVDATSVFLKSIFPHASAFFKVIKTKIEEAKKSK
jgi:hypothetical protein